MTLKHSCWRVYRCRQQGNATCLCVIHLSGGCVWCLCPTIENKNHSYRTTVFKSLDDNVSGKLKRPFCVGISTDGAAAMTRWLSGLTARIKEIAPECESTYCVIHREMLASQKMSQERNTVLNDAVKVIYHIKVHTLNSCLFEQLCKEMNREHRRLLLYTEIRWLSRGRLLARVFELREPL